MIAVLHDIRSLHNVGSMFRTADAAGVEKLYLCGITPSPFDLFGRVRVQFAKVSLGAENTVAWEAKKDALRLVRRLQEEGFTVFAVEQYPGSVPYDEALLPANGKVAFVVGNEVEGLPPAICDACDSVLEIPMHGGKESLNVSVSFGIIAYALRGHTKKRSSKKDRTK